MLFNNVSSRGTVRKSDGYVVERVKLKGDRRLLWRNRKCGRFSDKIARVPDLLPRLM